MNERFDVIGAQPMPRRVPTLLNTAAVRLVASAIRTIEHDSKSLMAELLSDRSCVVSFVNAHAMNLACRDPKFLEALMNAHIRLRDGFGVKILMFTLGRRPGLNMNGTDFIPIVLDACKTRSIALYGSSVEVASAAANALVRLGATRVTHCDGFQSTEHYLCRLRAEQPRVVVLGMGMPRQELIAEAIINEASWPILIVNGGAILDFMAGRFRRAPLFLRRRGLEWLYRFYVEPRRLWRRYLLGNVVFLARVVLSGLQCRLFGRSPPRTIGHIAAGGIGASSAVIVNLPTQPPGERASHTERHTG
jgi:exopolysaccharide biosynthesis WecB/TagA/CpsF family protein